MDARFPVTFAPSGVTVWVKDGSTVLEAARIAGIVIPAPCGGRGACGKCAIRIVDGHAAPPDDLERVGLARAPAGIRLACRTRVSGPMTVRPIVAGVATSSAGDDTVTDEEFFAGVDLGTTTVSAVIVGAVTGRELGRATVPNAQQSFGMDVVSRIAASLSGASVELRDLAESSMIDALNAACGAAGACLARVRRVVVAGNTGMTALASGVDVAGLATAPFEALAISNDAMVSPRLTPLLADGAEIHVARGLGGFVGGDVSVGLLASGLLSSDQDAVFVDIGTNAEVVVRSRGRIAYASVAAGPAFEGFGISSGGAAAPGAVTRVHGGPDLRVDVIGGGRPEWFAGSGLISAISVLLQAGHLDASGLMRSEGPYSGRFDLDDSGVARFAFGPDASGPRLTQLDVRAFQTAKAAVAAGLVAVARSARLKAKRVERVVVAGTFGAALEIADLVALGVMPEDVADRLESLSDAALTGAATLAFDPTALADIDRFRVAAVRVELATDRAFTELFTRATALAPFTLKKGF